MKKLIYIFCAFILSGCAVGINHNVATVDGTNYLIESRTRNLFYITQWSEKPKITALQEDELIKKSTVTYFNSVLSECKKQNEERNPSFKKIHNCIVKKFKELEKEIE